MDHSLRHWAGVAVLAVSAVAVTACGAQTTTRTAPAVSGNLTPTSAKGLLAGSQASIRKAIRQTLPPGTRIYRVPQTTVQEGTVSFRLAGAVQKINTTTGPVLMDEFGVRVPLTADAIITPDANGTEYYIRPGMPLPRIVQSRTPIEITGKSQ